MIEKKSADDLIHQEDIRCTMGTLDDNKWEHPIRVFRFPAIFYPLRLLDYFDFEKKNSVHPSVHRF